MDEREDEMKIKERIEGILIEVYKWARQDSEPPSCCISKATTDILKASELDEKKIKEIITWGGLLPYAKWGNQYIKISEEDKNTIAHAIAKGDVWKEER